MDARGALGRYGEDVAADLLQSMGMSILSRNWRCVAGELDIVARDGDALVVCEVKTRRSVSQGSPADAVGPRKMQRLRSLALHWLDDAELYIPTIRFDVVSVILPRAGAPIVTYLRGVE